MLITWQVDEIVIITGSFDLEKNDFSHAAPFYLHIGQLWATFEEQIELHRHI